jgi:hypothetical protein
LERIIRLGGVMLCVVSLSACATITRGTRQNYVIETDPAGANITLSTGQTCVTPCNLRLKRKHEFTVTATMAGYQDATASVDSRVRGGGAAGVAGNVIAGGVIGIVVDATNGSMNDLVPNPLRITMTRVGEAAPAAAEAAPEAAAEPAPAEPPSGTPQGE